MKKIIFTIIILIFCSFCNFTIAQAIYSTSGTNPGCVGNIVTMKYSYAIGNAGMLAVWKVNGVTQTTSTSFSYTIGSTTVSITANGVNDGGSAGCNLTPIATPPTLTAASNSPVCIGSPLNLTSSLKSTPSSTYLWSGPNSYSSTLQNPVVSSSATSLMSGNYSVVEVTAPATCNNCVTPQSKTCQSSPSTVSVLVSQPTTPTTTNNGPICTGNTLSLTASTISGATYSWSGPNGFTSSQQNPTVSTNATTAMAGNYSVIATANGCSSQPGTTNVVINQATAANNGPVCAGSTLSLTASSIPGATYYWTGPNGFSSTEQNPVVSTSATSAMAGVYYIYTTANGCTSPTPGTTTVIVNPIPATPSAGNNGPVCIGNPLSLTASAVTGATYSWTGPNGFTSTQQNPTVSTSATTAMGGVYSVIATVNGCASIAGTTTVEINKITASNNGPVCIGNTLSLSATSVTGATYSWTGPNSFTSSQQNPTVSTSATSAMGGVYSVTSTVNGCTSAASVTIVTINPAVAPPTVTSPITYCQNATATPLTATGTNLKWYTTPTGGTGSTTAPTPSTTTPGTTTYYVSQTNSCESPRASINVTVNPLPVAAGTITGNATVCQGESSVNYTVPTITNATSYVWTLPSGATGTSTTNSITVIYGTSAVSGNITVKGNNSCGDGAVSTKAITVNSLPVAAGTISGNATVCQGENSVTYTVPTITNATSYVWTLPSGATGTSTTNSITVNYGTSAASGNINVKGNNSCGDGAISTLAITVNPLPVAAGTITGNATVCQGESSINYTVPTITNATSYVWTLPSGATGTSTTNSITVNYGTSAVSGNITVKGNNSCGDGAVSTKAITVNPLPFAAGTISGNATVCQGENSLTYTVPTITNVTTYVWTLPGGATGTSTTNSITVSYGTSAVSGNITVKGNNFCGDGSISTLAITVNPLPVAAGTITGNATVCQGENSVNYTVPTITNATSYVWTLPSGATGTSTTNSITVNYGTSAVSGGIEVYGQNSCGVGNASIIPISVNSFPVSAGLITGTSVVCQGQNSVTYTVPTITNATSYIWSLPSGATGTSTSNSITVNYGTSATSGNITVKGHNSCGDGAISTLAITVNPLPNAAGTISGTTTVCQGQNSIMYAVPSISNASSYIWTLPSGANGSSSSNIITVSYGTSAVSGNITVKGNNSCGDGATSTVAITVNPLPVAAGTISGSAIVCQGENSVTYSVPAITNATSYVWSLPNGATGTSTTNSITVDYGTSAISGDITVKGTNSCGGGTASTLPITVNIKPTTPLITLNGLVLHSDAPYGNQWFNQNGLINGATNQNHTVTVDGDYYVIVSLSGCSSDPSNTINVTVTGIEVVELGRVFKVYPNPVSNELIIEIEGNNEKVNFDVFNAIGQIVFKGNVVDKTNVQTSDFAPGVYLIKLENGKTFEFKKIIKE